MARTPAEIVAHLKARTKTEPRDLTDLDRSIDVYETAADDLAQVIREGEAPEDAAERLTALEAEIARLKQKRDDAK